MNAIDLLTLNNFRAYKRKDSLRLGIVSSHHTNQKFFKRPKVYRVFTETQTYRLSSNKDTYSFGSLCPAFGTTVTGNPSKLANLVTFAGLLCQSSDPT